MDDQEALDLEIAFQEAAGENDSEVETNFADPEGTQTGDGEIRTCLGGYEYEFVDAISDDQKCPVCLFPMRDPVQTVSCGHRLCKECLNGIRRSGNPVCPEDRERIDNFFSDKAFARGMLSLRVKCVRNNRGCQWIGQLRHAEEHTGECSYEDKNCLACDTLVQRRHLETHQNDSCPKRIIECVHCQDEFTFIEKQEHEKVYCRRFPLTCPNNCGKEGIPREELKIHLSEKCLMSEVTCRYAKVGCPFQDKRAHLIDHIEASVEDHLEMTYSFVLAMEIERSADHDRMTEWQQKFHESEENNQKLLQSVKELSQSVKELSQSKKDHREQIRDLILETKRLEIKSIEQEKTIEEILKKNYLKEKHSIEDMCSKIAQHEIMIEKLQQRIFQSERKIEEVAQNNSRQEKTTSLEGQARKNPSQGMKLPSLYNTHQEDRKITNVASPVSVEDKETGQETDSDWHSCHETPPGNEKEPSLSSLSV